MDVHAGSRSSARLWHHVDDTEAADALALLLQDPPMTNMVHASGRFTINRWRGSAQAPCVLITATHGFFGYVGTPAECCPVLEPLPVRRVPDTHDWIAFRVGDDRNVLYSAATMRR